MSREMQFADQLGPRNGELRSDGASMVAVVALTGAGVQVIDLSSTTFFGSKWYLNAYVRLRPDVPVFFFWSDLATATLDETATGATTRERQCDALAANERVREIAGGRYLVIKSTGAGKIRIGLAQNPLYEG